MPAPENSKYFIDSHGVLCFDQQLSMDTKMRFKVSGVFTYQYYGVINPETVINPDYCYGFMVEKYRKFVKTK